MYNYGGRTILDNDGLPLAYLCATFCYLYFKVYSFYLEKRICGDTSSSLTLLVFTVLPDYTILLHLI